MSKIFENLLTGDTVVIKYTDDDDRERTRTITVGGLHDAGSGGKFVTTDDGVDIFFENDINSIEVTGFARKLPNADVIAWYPGNDVINTAARYGHPGNNVWSFNGIRISTDDLMENYVGDATVQAFDRRS